MEWYGRTLLLSKLMVCPVRGEAGRRLWTSLQGGRWEEERLWKRCFRSRYEAAGRECGVVPEME